MINGKKHLRARPRGRPWPRGVSGNPAGRPKGALNKLSLAVRGTLAAVNSQKEPGQVPTTEPEKYNPRQFHDHTMHKIDGRWRRTIEQDGRLFDRDTGILIGGVPLAGEIREPGPPDGN